MRYIFVVESLEGGLDPPNAHAPRRWWRWIGGVRRGEEQISSESHGKRIGEGNNCKTVRGRRKKEGIGGELGILGIGI